MKPSITAKLENLAERLQEINALLADPDTIADQNRFRELSMEYVQLKPVVDCFEAYQSTQEDIESANEMLQEDDADMREMAAEELSEAKSKIVELELELQKQLLPKDPNDNKNVYLEVRAGTGGDEAAIFAGDLFKMYS
ncbi:MAG: PCRF domain-containing protein, partial [Chromatiales bacterium]|nr:PCRF domain-containing protein [Chromatiales bacterium]